jgi:hypothetical protein
VTQPETDNLNLLKGAAHAAPFFLSAMIPLEDDRFGTGYMVERGQPLC